MMTSVCCPQCRADVGSVPSGVVGEVAARVLIGVHTGARHHMKRVVCAACHVQYASLTDGPDMMADSERLALAHAPVCAASRDEHTAGLAWVEAMTAAMEH